MRKDGYVHYPVLESETAKRGILKRDVIGILGVENSTFSNKITAKGILHLLKHSQYGMNCSGIFLLMNFLRTIKCF
ncbi:MAG: hypothetical protein K2O60_06630 [Ruminococcus sp.]|nr:hypothetical protein [Ruminococcus sp.]